MSASEAPDINVLGLSDVELETLYRYLRKITMADLKDEDDAVAMYSIHKQVRTVLRSVFNGKDSQLKQ